MTHGKSSYFPALSLVGHKNLNLQDSKGSELAGFSQQLFHGLPFRRERGKDWYFKRSCYGNVSCISPVMLKKVLLFRKKGHFITKLDIVFTWTNNFFFFERDHLRNWRLIKLREMTIYDQNGFHLHFVRPSIDFTFQLWTARGQLWPRERASNEPGSQ